MDPDAGRSGRGRRLFVAALAAALAHYSAMGFTPYRGRGDTIPHRFDVQGSAAGD